MTSGQYLHLLWRRLLLACQVGTYILAGTSRNSRNEVVGFGLDMVA